VTSLSTAGNVDAAPRATGSDPAVSLSLLGRFELRIDGAPIPVPSSAQRVIAFLSFNPGWLARVFVAGHLWMDASEERAAAALRTALWRLGKLGNTLVRCEGRSLRLNPDARLDVDEATRIAHDVLEDTTSGVSRGTFASLPTLQRGRPSRRGIRGWACGGRKRSIARERTSRADLSPPRPGQHRRCPAPVPHLPPAAAPRSRGRTFAGARRARRAPVDGDGPVTLPQ